MRSHIAGQLEIKAREDESMEQLQKELALLTVSALQRKAIDIGASLDDIDSAIDQKNPKEALASLILTKHGFERGHLTSEERSKVNNAELATSTSWLEVVAPKALVRSKPDANSLGLGVLYGGAQVEVQQNVIGNDGRTWAQLTDAQLMCCCPVFDQSTKGYVLIDGSQLGLGKLLDRPRDGNNKFRRNVLSAPILDEYFEVLKNLVLIKGSPNKNVPSVGQLRQGQRILALRNRVQDNDGYDWVELTQRQMRHSCADSDYTTRGFCLIDGSHLGLGALLRGPLPTPTEEELAAQYNLEKETEAAIAQANHEKAALIFHGRRSGEDMRRPDEQKRTYYGDLVQLQKDCEAKRMREWDSYAEGVPYRSLGEFTFVTAGIYPSTARVVPSMKRVQCFEGQRFFSTGRDWRGQDGSLWLEQSGGQTSWLLAEGQHGVYLRKEADMVDHTHVSIDYVASCGDIHIYDTFIRKCSTIRELKLRLCKETGLKSGCVILTWREERSFDNPEFPGPNIMQSPVALDEDRSLDSCNFANGRGLVLLYSGDFIKDYRCGSAYTCSGLVSLAKQLPKDKPTRNAFQTILKAAQEHNG